VVVTNHILSTSEQRRLQRDSQVSSKHDPEGGGQGPGEFADFQCMSRGYPAGVGARVGEPGPTPACCSSESARFLGCPGFNVATGPVPSTMMYDPRQGQQGCLVTRPWPGDSGGCLVGYWIFISSSSIKHVRMRRPNTYHIVSRNAGVGSLVLHSTYMLVRSIL
jgi:hypothetical protein